MKILLLHCYNIFAETGASANRWRTIVEGLSVYDVEFYIVITSGYKSVEEKIKYGRSGYINKKIRYQYISGQNRYSYWMSRINIYVLSKFHNVVNAPRINKIIKSVAPDVVLLYLSLEVFSIFCKIFPENHNDFKLMVEINEFNDIWDIHATNRLQKLNNERYNYYLTKRIFPRLDICLVMTDTLMRHYNQLLSMNTNVSFLKMPMTVDLGRFNNIKKNNILQSPYVAYCGSGDFYTDGVDILIKAFAKVSDDYSDLKLYIAAFWGKDGDKMIQLIHDTGMKGKVIYLGVIDRDEIPSFLVCAEVLALSRPDSRQAQGGFPTKLGEYLASGNAVCVTRVGEIPEYLVDNESAFFAEPGDINSFAESLKRALNDKTKAKRVGEKGRKVAQEHFSMDVQAKRLFDFLESNLRQN